MSSCPAPPPLSSSVHLKGASLSFSPVITSSSSRDYVVNSPDGSTQTRTYQWRQTITFQSCQHGDSWRDVKPTQLLSVDNVLALYDSNEVMRFTMTNKIGDVNGEVAVDFLLALSSHPSSRRHPVRGRGREPSCYGHLLLSSLFLLAWLL